MIQLHLLFPEKKSWEPAQEVHHARQALLVLLTERIKRLPKKISIARATPLIAAVEIYAALGRDLVHLVRFFEGVIALSIRERSRKGDAVVMEMSKVWQVAETTLRLYMRVARYCAGDVYIFDRYLLSEKERKTQKQITSWCGLMKDKELMPDEAAQVQRSRQVARAAREIEEAIEEEPDRAAQLSYVSVQAEASGVQIDYDNVSRETRLGSTFGSMLAWVDSQFGPLSLRGTVAHARKEAGEFILAVRMGKAEEIVEKAVDLMFLCAQIPGLAAAWEDGRETAAPEELIEALIEALQAKLEVNKARQWGKPDLDGAVEHIREEVAA